MVLSIVTGKWTLGIRYHTDQDEHVLHPIYNHTNKHVYHCAAELFLNQDVGLDEEDTAMASVVIFYSTASSSRFVVSSYLGQSPDM